MRLLLLLPLLLSLLPPLLLPSLLLPLLRPRSHPPKAGNRSRSGTLLKAAQRGSSGSNSAPGLMADYAQARGKPQNARSAHCARSVPPLRAKKNIL